MVKTFAELYLESRRAIAMGEDKVTASMYTKNLLCHVAGKKPEQLMADMQCYAPQEICDKMSELVLRTVRGEPLAYVLGEWDFHGMTLHVDKNVLIPRDDTCAVTDLAIRKALFLDAAPRILDLCTGSGCIGLAIANRVKDARVTLADISRDAIAVAKKNVSAQKLTGRVSCIVADALSEPLPFLGKFDMIVSNPPYITTAEMEELPKSVKDYEPTLALHGGTDGLNFYRSIAKNYAQALKQGGFICFEFGLGQGDSVRKILTNNGFTILEITRDYNNIERAVIAQYGRKED